MTKTNALLSKHRPVSAGGQRLGFGHRRNSPSNMLIEPMLNYLPVAIRGDKSSQKLKSTYKLNISLQCEYSCGSTIHGNESVARDNVSMVMNVSPQKANFEPTAAIPSPVKHHQHSQKQIQPIPMVKRQESQQQMQHVKASNAVSQVAEKGDVNTASCSVRDKQTSDDILMELYR